MSKRKSDNLEFVPSLSPSKDEVVHRRQGRARPTVQDVVDSGSTHADPAEDEGGSAFAVVITVMGFVALFLGLGYLFLQVQALQGELLSARQAAAEQVEVLNGRLSQTGEIMSKEGGDMGDKLKFHESEIRKLWDVANKRNKKAIDGNKRNFNDAIKQVSGKAKQNFAALSSVQAELDLVKVRQAAADKGVARLLTRATQIDLLQSNLGDRLENEVAALKALRNQVSKLSSAKSGANPAEVKALQEKLSSSALMLEKRVVVNEQAIKAIDSHRAQLNRNIERIQQENERVYRLVDSTLKTP